MKTIKKVLIVLLSAFLVALCGYQAGYYYQRSKPVVVQISESVVKHNNFLVAKIKFISDIL